MKYASIRFPAAAVLLLFALFGTAAQHIPTWRTAIEGDVIAGPYATEYGFICICDDRSMYAFTGSGTRLWKTPVKGSASLFNTVTADDFICTVSGGNIVTLYNSSGMKLWETAADGIPVCAPVQGRDGRIFVMTAGSLSCYGVTGQKKWRTALPFPPVSRLYTLNDGSLLYLTAADTATRVSPYGKLLENITFTGNITAAAETPDGFAAAFDSGETGFCAVRSGTFGTIWTVPAGAPVRALCGGGPLLLAIQADGYIYAYDTETGKTEWGFYEQSAASDPDVSVSYYNGVFNILAGTQGLGYTVDGYIQWKRTLPAKNAQTGIAYTPYGYLITGGSGWIVSGYRFDSPVTVRARRNRTYGYGVYRAENGVHFFTRSISAVLDETEKAVLSGNTGTREPEYAEFLTAVLTAGLRGGTAGIRQPYGTDLFSFRPGADEQQRAARLLAAFGSAEYQTVFTDIIGKSADMSVLIASAEALGTLGYDPEGAGLRALETLVRRIPVREEAALAAVCDGIYGICRFMGKPAILSKGKDILASMMSAQYSAAVRAYAALSLEKLIADTV